MDRFVLRDDGQGVSFCASRGPRRVFKKSQSLSDRVLSNSVLAKGSEGVEAGQKGRCQQDEKDPGQQACGEWFA